MMTLKAMSWTWYGCVSLVTVCRFISRYLNFGSVKALQLDDWLMALAFTTYTVDIVFLNVVAVTPTNLFEPGTNVATFTAEDIARRVYGSKLTFLVELCQCVTVWTVKACLLIMYLRITARRTERVYMKAMCYYVGIGFVLMEVLYLGVWCNPIKDYWQVSRADSCSISLADESPRAVPTPNIQCSAATNHLITNATLNLSSDAALLCIAIPIFLKTMMTPRKKAALCAVFSLGIFNIIAAILNKYYSFTNPFGTEWTAWYCHESSTAMMVANVPFLYTLLRRVFNLRSLNGSDYYDRHGYGRNNMATPIRTRTGAADRKSHDDPTLLVPHSRHSYGSSHSLVGDVETGAGAGQGKSPVTVTTDIEVMAHDERTHGAEAAGRLTPREREVEMDFLRSGGRAGHTVVIRGNERRAGGAEGERRSVSVLSVPDAVVREPERAAEPGWRASRSIG